MGPAALLKRDCNTEVFECFKEHQLWRTSANDYYYNFKVMNAFFYSNMSISKGYPDDCPRGKLTPPPLVRVRASFRVEGQFSSGTTVLESQKELRFVFVKISWKYEIDPFPIRILRRCHNSKKISPQQYVYYTEAAIQSWPCKETIKIAENPQECIFYINRFH